MPGGSTTGKVASEGGELLTLMALSVSNVCTEEGMLVRQDHSVGPNAEHHHPSRATQLNVPAESRCSL